MKQGSSDPFAQMCALFGLGSLYMFIVSIVMGQFQLPTISVLPYFAFGAVAALLGSYCINTAYKLIEASEVTILTSSQRLFSVLAAFIFLGEPFSPIKLTAASVVIVGVVIASWKHHTMKWDKGAILAILAALLFCGADIAGYYIVREINPISFIAFSYLLPVLIIFPIRPKTFKHLRFYKNPRNGILIVIAAAVDAVGYFSFSYAYVLSQDASQIAPLLGFRVILTIVLGALFLRERDNLKKKFIGGAIIILGSTLLLFQ